LNTNVNGSPPSSIRSVRSCARECDAAGRNGVNTDDDNRRLPTLLSLAKGRQSLEERSLPCSPPSVRFPRPPCLDSTDAPCRSSPGTRYVDDRCSVVNYVISVTGIGQFLGRRVLGSRWMFFLCSLCPCWRFPRSRPRERS